MARFTICWRAFFHQTASELLSVRRGRSESLVESNRSAATAAVRGTPGPHCDDDGRRPGRASQNRRSVVGETFRPAARRQLPAKLAMNKARARNLRWAAAAGDTGAGIRSSKAYEPLRNRAIAGLVSKPVPCRVLSDVPEDRVHARDAATQRSGDPRPPSLLATPPSRALSIETDHLVVTAVPGGYRCAQASWCVNKGLSGETAHHVKVDGSTCHATGRRQAAPQRVSQKGRRCGAHQSSYV